MTKTALLKETQIGHYSKKNPGRKRPGFCDLLPLTY